MLKAKRLKKLLAGLAIFGVLFASAQILRRTSPMGRVQAPEYRKKGNPRAKVTIVEYSDFQCPACKGAQPVLEGIFKDYEGQIKIVFKHMPLEKIHKWARASALAAECAGQQKKFWPFHDTLYASQQDWVGQENVNGAFEGYAKHLGLNLESFRTCLQDQKINDLINADIREADIKKVGSTPTFFINDQRLVGGDQLLKHGRRFIEAQLRDGK